jgi:hypothetical protein
MWPRGEAEVCKTFNEGSNPSMASHGKQSLVSPPVSTGGFFKHLYDLHRSQIFSRGKQIVA